MKINNKAPGVFMTGGFSAALDVSDFIISAWSKIGNDLVQDKLSGVFMSMNLCISSNILVAFHYKAGVMSDFLA